MITFTAINSDTISIDYPEWSYTPRVHMAFEIIKTSFGYSLWDNGIEFDYRTCEIDRCYFGSTLAAQLDAFLENHYGETLQMDIGTASNFFPFLPDMGDAGIFGVKILDRKFGEYDQFRQFSKSINMLMVTHPSFVLPEFSPQGNFKIGTVDGLMFPQLGIGSEVEYGTDNSLSYGGTAGFISADHNVYTTKFVQRCNKGLAAALINFLTGEYGRDHNIAIESPSEFFLFGATNGSSGGYSTKLIQNIIECKHIDFEEFEIGLNFWMDTV